MIIAVLILGFGALSGIQSDTGYWTGEDIGASTPSYDSGYSMETTYYTGDDIGGGIGG